MSDLPKLQECITCHQPRPACYHTPAGPECPGCYEPRIARESREKYRDTEPLGATGHMRGDIDAVDPDPQRIRVIRKF